MSKNDRYAHLGGNAHDTDKASRSNETDQTVEVTLRKPDGDKREFAIETNRPLEELVKHLRHGETPTESETQAPQLLTPTPTQQAILGAGVTVAAAVGVISLARRRKAEQNE